MKAKIDSALCATRFRVSIFVVLALLLAAIGLFAGSSVRAQSTIIWGTPTAIAGDTDVATNGTLVYAYTESGQWTTVNGVSFASGTSAVNLGGADATMANLGSGGGVDTGSYIGSNPLGISSAYQTLVKGGAFNNGVTATISLNNLTSGHQYLVQYWVADYRAFGGNYNRSETLAAGNTSGALTYLQIVNGVSQGATAGTYVKGTFTASGTSQAITVTPSGNSLSAQMNAIQVRDLTPSPAPVQVPIYQDLFNDQQNINPGYPYTQTLAGSYPTVRNAIAGGSASATWTGNAEVGGWGQRDSGNNGVATPTSSNYLPFTPQAGHLYLLTATIDATAWGNGEWFSIAFCQSPGNYGGTGNLVWDLTNNLVRGGQAKTVSVTLDTRAPGWTNSQGLGYVGWVTDVAGQVNLGNGVLTIDNFSLALKNENPITNTYAANGATGGTVPVDGTIYSSNTAVTVLGNTGSLAKTGYNFAGWNTAADGSGTAYSAGGTFTITNNTVLYAQWTVAPVQTLLLSDNFNSGSYGVSAFNSTLAADQSGLLAPLNYSVAGYNADYKIQHGNGGQMLLAGWQASQSLDLYASLNANFAAYANTYNQPLKVQFDLTVTSAPDPSNWAAFAIGGAQNLFVNNAGNKFSSLFRFNGGTEQFASGTDVSSGFVWTPSGTTITVILSDTNSVGSAFNGKGSLARIYTNGILAYTRTLSQMAATDGYVSFEADGTFALYDNFSVSLAPIYSVTYTGNGSTGGTVPADSRSPYAAASTVTVLGNTGSLTNNGHYFAGWNTAANGSGTAYLPGNTFAITNNTILYAQWASGYTIAYNGNGNTGGSAPVDANFYAPGVPATVLGNGTLSNSGYAFASWNTAANGSGISYLPGATLTLSNSIQLYAQWNVVDVTWNNGAGTGNWNSTDTNWTGFVWSSTQPCNAYYTTVGGTINLTQPITAGSVNFGNTSLNAPNITLTNGSLAASSLTVQGYNNNANGYSGNPTLTLGVPTVSVAGDIAVGRASLVIASGNVTANRIISAAASADWADVAINGGTVTATNGVDGSVNTAATFQLDLNSGALYTPFIKVADRESGGGAWLNFNGTVLHPTVNTNNFITLYGGNQNTYVGNGGVNFSTDGHDIGVSVNLLVSGTGGLTKTGSGKLTLSGTNTYTGPTHVLGGVLSLASTNSLGSLPVDITNGTAMNLNYSGQIQVTGLTLNGVAQPIGTYGATGSGATYINNTYFSGTGVLNVVPIGVTWNNGAGTRNWNSTDLNWSGYVWNKKVLHGAIFDSVGVGTVTLTEAITAQFVTFNTAGYTLTNGSLTLTGSQMVSNNVSATIASPIISGALNKYGNGTLTLNGINTYSGGTTVNAGTLQLVANGGNCPLTGTLTVNAGATVTATGDGTGLGFNSGQKISTLNINGGTVSSAGTMDIWNQGGGVNLTGGTLSASALQWGDTVVNTYASTTNSVIAGQINIRADDNSPNASLLQLNVADGPAATDLLISANITEGGLPVNATTGGHCGISKTGAGTLRLTGSVQISGVISVEAGTLDFAPSAVSTNARIFVASGAHLLLSSAVTNVLKNVNIDGVKLAAGRWGAPGSVAAGTADFESPVFSGAGVLQMTDTGVSNRDRWKRMKYGQFTHYVWNGGTWGTTRPDGSLPSSIDELANNFDATQYANDLQSMGVEYVIFTAWHANFFPLFNSAAVVRTFGFMRNSSRDMVGDMIAAVRAKGIRVYFYTHPDQPVIYDYTAHNNMINDVYGELIDRYGDQIDGIYFDENDPGGNQDNWVDYPRLERTIHRRNPDLLLMQNFYGNLYACDVPSAEWGSTAVNYGADVGSPSVGHIAEVCSQGGWAATWSTNAYAAARTPQGIFRAAVVAAASCTEGGGVAWAAGPHESGPWEQGVKEMLQGAGQLMAPVAVAVTNTYPSSSFSFSWSWGGATRSMDDSKEYIHVLWPPGGNSLTLPAPADGKVFANARLLANSNAVTMTQNSRAVQLTLTGTNTWNTNDTVIALDVISAGDLYLANDTSSGATYTGSWTYQRNRNTTEFCRDVHETTANGDYVEFAFNGTDIQLLGTGDSSHGTVDIYLDGVFQQTVSAQTASPQYRKVIYSQSGLARGSHKLKAVKTGGTYFTVDGFRASELVDSAQPDVSYQALSFFNDTATTPNGVGYIVYDSGWNYQYRPDNSYNADEHWAQSNGSTFWINFNGTGVQFISTKGGVIDFYLDGTYVTEVNMNNFGSLTRNIGLDLRGLPPGNHTLTGVKVGDTYAFVDAFFVYNTQNSGWFNQSDSTSISNSYQRSYAYSDVATVPFQGTGIEVIAPHSSAGGTVAVSISSAAPNLQGAGYQGFAGEDVSQYAGATAPQTVSFASRNVTTLAPGNYLLSMSHNRSFGSIALDGFRVYKNQPGTGLPYYWGATGGGGSGTWDVNATVNWWDGYNSQVWYDGGAADYAAIFGGTAGTVSLASGINVNRLTFNTTGYTLTNNSINFNGLNPSVTVVSNVAATVASTLTGSANLTVNGPGTLTLSGANAYTGGTTVNGGLLELKNNSWILGNVSGGSVTVSNGATLRANNSVANQLNGLALANGTVDAVNSAANSDWGNFFLTGNVSATGASYLNAQIALRAASVTIDVASGGTLNIGGVLHNGYQFASTGTPGGSPANVIKSGSGTLRFNSTNTYTGSTTVSAGTLGGTGSIASAVTVQSGATLAPGASIGTLIISNTLTLQAGSQTVMEINAASATNDLVRGLTAVNYGGTLAITNLAVTVSAGQTFKLFSAASRTGNFSAITGVPGVTWNFNPTNGVLTAVSVIAMNSTNMTVSLNGTNLTLSWPSDHAGWTLMQQTNHLNLGISMNTNDWMRVSGSSVTNYVVIPILPTAPGGYYRIVYP